jgi:hypothetical protein
MHALKRQQNQSCFQTQQEGLHDCKSPVNSKVKNFPQDSTRTVANRKATTALKYHATDEQEP